MAAAVTKQLFGRFLTQYRNRIVLPKTIFMGSFLSSNQSSSFKDLPIVKSNTKLEFPKKFSESDLKTKLNDLQYYVTQEKGTERAFNTDSEHLYQKDPGVFNCIVCDEKIFESKTKFESGSGWPSFYDVLSQDRVKLIEDKSYGMRRVEVACAGCGAHLGHVFSDGPKPTGLRYCINSASLSFTKKD